MALLHELGSFMHIDFNDCYACNWNKQIYTLLTESIRKISQKLSFKFVIGNNKIVTGNNFSFVIHRPTLQSLSARQYHA